MEQPVAQKSEEGSTEDVTFACWLKLMPPWMKREERELDYVKLSTKGEVNEGIEPKTWMGRTAASVGEAK